MIDLALLGLLKERPLHGYELKKRLGELLGPRASVSFGSLYPALAKLERAGEVEAVEVDDEAVATTPMTGSIAGELAAFRARRRPRRDRRGRKVYGITERGERRFLELLSGEVADDRAFALAVAFCRFLPSDRRVALFQHRRAAVAGRMAATEAALTMAGEDGQRPDRYRLSLLQHQVESLASDLAWLDGLIEAERDRGVPTPTGGNHR
ncbi:MAG TPA: PadR family transcriptional regulator [Acidimicrobiales bacterium]